MDIEEKFEEACTLLHLQQPYQCMDTFQKSVVAAIQTLPDEAKHAFIDTVESEQ